MFDFISKDQRQAQSQARDVVFQVATKLDKFRTYEQIVDEKDSGFFQKDHTIHQCFDWLVFKIFYKSVIFSKNNGFF